MQIGEHISNRGVYRMGLICFFIVQSFPSSHNPHSASILMPICCMSRVALKLWLTPFLSL
jgi:hypothetical protein